MAINILKAKRELKQLNERIRKRVQERTVELLERILS